LSLRPNKFMASTAPKLADSRN